MKLTSYTNYALRCLQLAAIRAPNLVRTDDVVAIHGISRAHIVKVIHELGKAGYIQTVRGRNGGFKLNQPAHDIVVGAVVRITEGPLTVVECFNPKNNTCPLIGICRLSNKIQEATKAFMDVLDDVTIADIAANRAGLLERINILELTGDPTPFLDSAKEAGTDR